MFSPFSFRLFRVALAALAIPGLVSSAQSGIVPLDNRSQIFTRSVAGNVVDSDFRQASGIAPWNGLANADADNGAGTFCGSTMALYTDMADSSLSGNANGSGFGTGSDVYHHNGYADLRLLFLVNTVQEYSSSVGLSQGNIAPDQPTSVGLFDLGINAYWKQTSYGSPTQRAGRIAPGTYWLIGHAGYAESNIVGSCDGYFATLAFVTCTTPLVATQPQDRLVAPGATVDLQLTPTSPEPLKAAPPTNTPAANTYQWRRNLVNLANGGRISGVTTTHLVIANAVPADTGRYDCVVTQGSIVEPSRQAVVTVSSTTDVGPAPLTNRDIRFAAPRPNPFHGCARVQFELARPGSVSLAVHDALGRRVKSLLPDQAMTPGLYAIDWNGTDEGGAQVASGVYFVLLSSGGTRLTQRVVLLADR